MEIYGIEHYKKIEAYVNAGHLYTDELTSTKVIVNNEVILDGDCGKFEYPKFHCGDEIDIYTPYMSIEGQICRTKYEVNEFGQAYTRLKIIPSSIRGTYDALDAGDFFGGRFKNLLPNDARWPILTSVVKNQPIPYGIYVYARALVYEYRSYIRNSLWEETVADVTKKLFKKFLIKNKLPKLIGFKDEMWKWENTWEN